jgi:hypothetical protein
MYQFEPARIIDGKGNNAVVKCPECDQPFLVSGQWYSQNPRACPHCGAAEAICNRTGVDAYKTAKVRRIRGLSS